LRRNDEHIDEEVSDGQADLKRIERGIELFQRSRNQYFKRAVWIYIFGFAVLEVLGFLYAWQTGAGFSARSLRGIAFLGALIPVALYFFFEWLRNNFLSRE
jgi:hypothetical protein